MAFFFTQRRWAAEELQKANGTASRECSSYSSSPVISVAPFLCVKRVAVAFLRVSATPCEKSCSVQSLLQLQYG